MAFDRHHHGRDRLHARIGTAHRRPAPRGGAARVRASSATAARWAALGLASLAVLACAPQHAEPPTTAGTAASAPHAAGNPDRQRPGAGDPAAVARPRHRPAGAPQLGKASYYGPEFTGRKMANGRRFDPGSVSVAHRTLPFGTTVLVTHLGNGRSTTAVVEDRGPFVQGRIIDLSPRLAEHLGMVRQGVAPVVVMPVELAEASD
jgi:rare lipoprotein A